MTYLTAMQGLDPQEANPFVGGWAKMTPAPLASATLLSAS